MIARQENAYYARYMYVSEKNQENYWPAAVLWVVSLSMIVIIGAIIFIGTLNQLKSIAQTKKITDLEKIFAQSESKLAINSNEILTEAEIYRNTHNQSVLSRIQDLISMRKTLLDSAWDANPEAIIANRIDATIIDILPDTLKSEIEVEQTIQLKFITQLSNKVYTAQTENSEQIQVFAPKGLQPTIGVDQQVRVLKVSSNKYILLTNR